MTTWTTPCDSNGCIQTRTVDDRVEIRDSANPDATLLVPGEAWAAYEAAVEARAVAALTAERDALLEEQKRWAWVRTSAPVTWAHDNSPSIQIEFETDAHRAEVDALRAELDQLRAELEEERRINRSLMTDLEDADAAADRLRPVVEAAEAERDALAARLAQAERVVEAARAMVGSLVGARHLYSALVADVIAAVDALDGTAGPGEATP